MFTDFSCEKSNLWQLHWRHNGQDGVSNHQPHGCLLNYLFRRRSKKASKYRVTGLCVGNSPGPVNSPHKGPVTRKMFPFDDVIIRVQLINNGHLHRISSTPLITTQKEAVQKKQSRRPAAAWQFRSRWPQCLGKISRSRKSTRNSQYKHNNIDHKYTVCIL